MFKINKITILIIVSLLLVLAIVVMDFMIKQKEKSAETPPVTNNTTPPAYPIEPPSQQKARPALIGTPHYIVVKDAANPTAINNNFQAFTKKATLLGAPTRQWAQFTDSNNIIIPVDKVAEATGLQIHEKLHEIIEQYDYDVAACNTEGAADYAFQLTVKYVPGYPENVFDAAERFMKEWETTLLKDTHTILFPNDQIPSDVLQSDIPFKDGAFRYAEFELPGGEKRSINYAFVGNYIVVSSSKDCLEQSSHALIAPE